MAQSKKRARSPPSSADVVPAKIASPVQGKQSAQAAVAGTKGKLKGKPGRDGEGRPAKKARVSIEGAPQAQASISNVAALPPAAASPTQPIDLRESVLGTLEELLGPSKTVPKPQAAAVLPPNPHKRVFIPGKVNKLGLPTPLPPKTALSGNRLAAAPSARLSPNVQYPLSATELFISRKTSFTAYLKKGLDVFRKGKGQELRIKAIGAAIGMALSLALAVEDALGAGEGTVRREVITGTQEVKDEIVPEDPNADFAYQTRLQPSVEITLRLIS